MRLWVVVFGVFVVMAAAWPAAEPALRPSPARVDEAVPVPAPPPVPAAPDDPVSGRSSRDPGAPPPPPEPPPQQKPSYPYGEILGCVEDEDGCAVASFRLATRHFAWHRRRGRPAGDGETGPGGTFRFRVKHLDFFREPVPPGDEPSRWLFHVWAPGFVAGKYELGEEEESALRRGGRVTGVRIVLPRAVVVQGQVFWPDGRLVKGHGVTVTTREDDKVVNVSHARTDKHGWYRFSHLRPRAGLRIHAEATLGDSKHRTSSERVPLGDEPVAGDLLHVDLRLRPWVSER